MIISSSKMPTRYFKATDGHRTVFRASKSRQYLSASFLAETAFWHFDIKFSTKAPGGDRSFPATEITKAEYDALNATKVRRIGQGGRNQTCPQYSWVLNSEIAPRPGE